MLAQGQLNGIWAGFLLCAKEYLLGQRGLQEKRELLLLG